MYNDIIDDLVGRKIDFENASSEGTYFIQV